MRLRDKLEAGVSKREDFLLVPRLSALLIIDVQKYISQPNHSEPYFSNESLPRGLNNIGKLSQAFRVMRDDTTRGKKTGCEVIWAYLQSKTTDGRDISVDYRLSGPLLANIPKAGISFNDMFLDNLRPDLRTGKGDILLSKTSCSVFQSTNLDYLLRNLGVEQLVVVGQLTDQCVESAVRDAADLGYFVTVVIDACIAKSADAHQKGLDSMACFARIVDSCQVVDELLSDVAHTWSLQNSQRQVGLPTGLTDDIVLQYLRGKGLHSAAETLEQSFGELHFEKEPPKAIDSMKRHSIGSTSSGKNRMRRQLSLIGDEKTDERLSSLLNGEKKVGKRPSLRVDRRHSGRRQGSGSKESFSGSRKSIISAGDSKEEDSTIHSSIKSAIK
jgi:ureidoacrylate peracid hydrolase